jgi:hypothetical protein
MRNSIRVLSPLLTPLLRSTSTGRTISPSSINDSIFPITASTANQLHVRAPHIFKIYPRLQSQMLQIRRVDEHTTSPLSAPTVSFSFNPVHYCCDLDFVIQLEDRIGSENRQWRHYFRDRPPSACILRGTVLENISSYSLVGIKLSHQPKLISSGREILARLHKCDVLHSDISNLHHALVANLDRRIVWVGFAISFLSKQRA